MSAGLSYHSSLMLWRTHEFLAEQDRRKAESDQRRRADEERRRADEEKRRQDFERTWSELYRLVKTHAFTGNIMERIRTHPNEVTDPISNGDTPFRLAVRMGYERRITRAMLAVATNRGVCPPLMEALCPNPNVSVDMDLIRDLLKKCSGADRSHPHLLEHVCSNGKPSTSLELVDLLVQHCPLAVQTRGALRKLPLHHSCESGMSKEVVQYFLDVFPGACSESCEPQGTDGLDARLPVELACAAEFPNVDVVELLINQHRADNVPVNYGNLLLLTARGVYQSYFDRKKTRSACTGSIEVAKVLIPRASDEECRKAVRLLLTGDSYGFHWECPMALEFVQVACQLKPGLVSFRDGSNLLNDAIRNGFVDIARYLCHNFSALASQKDKDGCLPLHVASLLDRGGVKYCTNGMRDVDYRKTVLQRMLVAQYPEALAVRTNGGRTPNEMAGRDHVTRSITKEEDFLCFCTKKHGWVQSRRDMEKALAHQRAKAQTALNEWSVFHLLFCDKSPNRETPRAKAHKRVRYLREILHELDEIAAARARMAGN